MQWSVRHCNIPLQAKIFIVIFRVGQDRMYAPYMTVYLVISLLRILYIPYLTVLIPHPPQNNSGAALGKPWVQINKAFSGAVPEVSRNCSETLDS